MCLYYWPFRIWKIYFLRCLNLLEVPDEGEIIIEGESILEKGKILINIEKM